MTEWLNVAMQPKVVKRALKIAVIVGVVLILINHGDAILKGELDTTRALKMGLTVLVPYMVSTFSSVGAILEKNQ